MAFNQASRLTRGWHSWAVYSTKWYVGCFNFCSLTTSVQREDREAQQILSLLFRVQNKDAEHLRKALSSSTPAWPRIQPPLSPWRQRLKRPCPHLWSTGSEEIQAFMKLPLRTGQDLYIIISIYYILHTSLPTPVKVVVPACHHTSSFLWKNKTSQTEAIYFIYPVTLLKINMTVFAANIWKEIMWPLETRLRSQQSGWQ